MTKELWMLLIVPISLLLFLGVVLFLYLMIEGVREYEWQRDKKRERQKALGSIIQRFSEEVGSERDTEA